MKEESSDVGFWTVIEFPGQLYVFIYQFQFVSLDDATADIAPVVLAILQARAIPVTIQTYTHHA